MTKNAEEIKNTLKDIKFICRDIENVFIHVTQCEKCKHVYLLAQHHDDLCRINYCFVCGDGH